ncbi:MAG: hypothetical protein H0V07_15670 [Propionibacteriales bacterium]|nr:hypothetical protein [Propionibacteriales bacterium]
MSQSPEPPSMARTGATVRGLRRFGRRRIGRRHLLQWTGAALGAGTVGASTLGTSPARAGVVARGIAAPMTMATQLVTATPSDTLVEAMGARINTQLATSAYGDLTSMRDAVAYIGLRYAREATVLPSFNATQASHQQEGWPMLAAIGCRMVTTLGKASGKEGSVAAFASYHKSQFGGDTGSVLWGVESANEWNGRRGPGNGSGVSALTGRTYSATYPIWAEQLAVWQRSMWQSYKNDVALNGLAVVGPALVNATPGNSKVLVDVANIVYKTTTGIQPYLTHGNYHVYPGQAAGLSQPSVPSWHIDQKVSAMAVQAPGRPFVCTESGMHNASASVVTAFSAHSLKAAGIYAPRMTLEHLMRGSTRQWYFQLVDEYPDPTLTEMDSEFGLFNNDWTPKPAATAWKRMVSLFTDPGPAFTPPGIQMAVSGPALRSMLFQKRDGTALLALWRDVSVYDYKTKSDVSVTAETATVELQTPSAVRVYRPSLADGVTDDLGTGVTTAAIPLAGEVVVLEIF